MQINLWRQPVVKVQSKGSKNNVIIIFVMISESE